jgi:hypothetical protein
MKGSRPQSFSVAGSVPSSAPNHSSISGPLYPLSTLFLQPDQASDSVHCPPLSRVIVNAPRMVEVHNAHKRVERSHGSRRPLRRCGEAGSRVLRDPWEGSRPHVAGRDRGCGDESPRCVFSLTKLGCLEAGASAFVDRAQIVSYLRSVWRLIDLGSGVRVQLVYMRICCAYISTQTRFILSATQILSTDRC